MSKSTFTSLRNTFVGVSVVVSVLLCLAWWRPWYVPPVPNLIRVGYLPIYVDLPLFVALEEDFFSDQKVLVEPVRFQSSPDMGVALALDRIDAAASIATSSALGVETRDPGVFKIFLVDAETASEYLSSLLVASSSEVVSVSELKSKVIGSFSGPTAKLFGPLALEALGLARGDYEISEMPIGSHISALETGRVDAVITYEPTATQAVAKYGSRKLVPRLVESNVIDPWQAGIWIISTKFIDRDPDLSIRFSHAIYNAVEFIRRNPDRAKESLSPFTTIDLDVAHDTPNIPFTKVWEADLVTLQRHADMLAEEGMIQRKVEIPDLIMDLLRDKERP